MTPSAENAPRFVARRCRDEILKAIDGRPKSEHDRIITGKTKVRDALEQLA